MKLRLPITIPARYTARNPLPPAAALAPKTSSTAATVATG